MYTPSSTPELQTPVTTHEMPTCELQLQTHSQKAVHDSELDLTHCLMHDTVSDA